MTKHRETILVGLEALQTWYGAYPAHHPPIHNNKHMCIGPMNGLSAGA